MRLRRVLLTLPMLLLSAPVLAQDARPLPPDVAKDLELFGEGVVGKALPAPPLDDPVTWYMGTPAGGTWTYHVIKGENKHLRKETIKPTDAPSGQKKWTQHLGDEYVQYAELHADGSFGKSAEDDLDVAYTSRFDPGVFLALGLAAGESKHIKNKLHAFKTAKPDHILYTGDMDVTVTNVGTYEVTTPAGTWPALLMRSEYDIKIGPAKVKDVQYSFYAKGVGKIAEIEALHVAAILIYHSNEKTAKVLAEKPTFDKN